MKKGFGFIQRPDGSSLFFHFSKFPKGQTPAVGDELEYEVGTDAAKPAGKQNFADRLKLVKKGSGTAPAKTKTSSQPAAPPVNSPEGDLDGEIQFGVPVEQAASDGSKYDEVPVMVVAKYKGKPTKGVSVEARAYADSLGQVVTPEGGKAYFSAALAKGATRPYFEATLSYGKETKVVSAYWDNKPPSTDPDRLDVTVSPFPDQNGMFRVTCICFAGDRQVKGKISLNSSEALTIMAADKTSLGAGSSVSLETGDDGTLEVLIGFASPVQTTVTYKLSNKKGKPQQKLLVKP